MEKSPITKIRTLLSGKKKIIRTGKQFELALELLKPELPSVKVAREQAYAEKFMRMIKGELKSEEDSGKFDKFCTLMGELESGASSVETVFENVQDLLKSHDNLIDCFIPFLTHEQAIDCGIFMDYLEIRKMVDFLYMLETYFAKSPQQMKKIVAVLEKLERNKSVTPEEVTSSMVPLLRGNTVLIDHFMQFIPTARPSERFLTDFEEIKVDDFDEFSCCGQPLSHSDPDDRECPCYCHLHQIEASGKNLLQHCAECSIKYVNGRIFMKTGKNLRRAKVTFDEGTDKFHKDRLLPKRRKRKRSNSVTSTWDSDTNPESSKAKRKIIVRNKAAKSVAKGMKQSSMKEKLKSPPDNFSDQVEKSEEIGRKAVASSSGAWRIEEDRIILHTLQVENYCEETFEKISRALPSRTVQDIKLRVQDLLNMLCKMKTEG